MNGGESDWNDFRDGRVELGSVFYKLDFCQRVGAITVFHVRKAREYDDDSALALGFDVVDVVVGDIGATRKNKPQVEQYFQLLCECECECRNGMKEK